MRNGYLTCEREADSTSFCLCRVKWEEDVVGPGGKSGAIVLDGKTQDVVADVPAEDNDRLRLPGYSCGRIFEQIQQGLFNRLAVDTPGSSFHND